MRLRRAKWLLLPLGLFIGYQLVIFPRDSQASEAIRPESPVKTAHASSTPNVRFGTLRRLEIPKLHISAPIIPVGVTATNDMDVPHSAHEIGWYKFGAVPGRPGNAVLAGHRGLENERAVFWNLDKLAVGDALSVRDDDHQSIRFKVTGKEYYTPQHAPRERVFGPTKSTVLHLITCDGTYVKERDDYTKRLVVSARPVN